MPYITEIRSRMIFDSRGNPTVETDVILESGAMGRAAVPSGASKGKREALELRDGGEDYGGSGVRKAIKNIRDLISPELVGKDATNQADIDGALIALDGTTNKSRLGANAILSVSMACSRAAAVFYNQELYRYIGGTRANLLPVPMMNILNGGVHADNRLDIQEFMVIPTGAKSFAQAMQMGTEVYHSLKRLLKERGFRVGVGDEGGFAPDLPGNEDALKLIVEAAARTRWKLGEEVAIGIDAAASEFFSNGKYEIEGKNLSSQEMINLYSKWCEEYPIVSIEDGIAEEDWDGWKALTDALGDKIQIVGDDLFVTNETILQEGIDKGVANAILLKLNQIGTVSETINTFELARRNGYGTIISHRSGETEGSFIADLAVALNAGQIKSGAPCRSERVAKYNQLLRIEEELGIVAEYNGRKSLARGRRGAPGNR